MGLSRKLGNVSNPRNESMEVTYKWSTQSYTIQDILEKFKLPCIVQCATDQCSISWSKFQFDLRCPTLLYSTNSIRKVHARNLHMVTKDEFGPPVAIPEDYEGWFGASPKAASQALRHTRIESILLSNTRRFIVCTKCPAFTRSTPPSGAMEFIPRDITPGELFQTVSVMEMDVEDPNTVDIIIQHGDCLVCLDEKEDEVIIPLNRRAICFEISESYPDVDRKVFNIKSLIAAGNSKLPRIVSIVHGERPHLDYAYTGMLRCYSVFTEETILAATLDDMSPVCLELTTDSTAKFRLNLNESVVKRTCEYNNAFQMCKSSGDVFLRGIKVSFSLTPDASGLDEADLSVSEIQSVSDTQETDANSEFEIAWSSENTGSSRSDFATFLPDPNATNPIVREKNSKSSSSKPKKKDRKESSRDLDIHNLAHEDSVNPFPDFSEKAIANLMVQKGMIQRLGGSSSSDLNLTEEIETLRKAKAKVNPLFFTCNDTYAAVHKSENSANAVDDDYQEIGNLNSTTDINGSAQGTQYTNESRLESENTDYITETHSKKGDYGIDDSKSTEGVYNEIDDDMTEEEAIVLDSLHDASDIVEVSLDESDYSSIPVYKQANEYHEDELDSEDDDPDTKPIDGNSNGANIQDGGNVSLHNDKVNENVEIGPEEPKERSNLSYDVLSQRDELIISSDFGTIPIRTSVSAEIPQTKNEIDSTMNTKKSDSKHLLHTFKSESNISKIFGKFKGSDNSDKSKSSKKNFFQMRKSFPDKNKDTKPINVDDENCDELLC